jgi:predicted dehydrogenase
MRKLKIGIIGLGNRGRSVTRDVLVDVENIEITALCDLYEDRIEEVAGIINEKCGYTPALLTNDYKEVVDSENVEAVLVIAAWEMHIPMAIYSMKKNKPVGVEVAGAYSIDQCWELVKTYEETKTPIMMLENACYGRRELMLNRMVKEGLFGTVVHCDGAYGHDLRREVSNGIIKRHYRLRNYQNRNCENYPTHELGPIAQLLDINHGNRMISLVSVASKSAGLHEYIMKNHADDENLVNMQFAQGDIITTIIKCAHGETITLTLDTSLPRYYTRNYTIHGTKALYDERNDSIFFDGGETNPHAWKPNWGNAEQYEEQYDHPIWQKYIKEGLKGGHGGKDWLVYTDFIDRVLENKPMWIDVYDMATWMAITPLSERSIATGSQMVEIPDFTNGKWVL